MNMMHLQYNREKGIFINVELELIPASDIQEQQRNFADSIPGAVLAMLKVTLKNDVHLIKQPWPYFVFHAAGSPHCCCWVSCA